MIDIDSTARPVLIATDLSSLSAPLFTVAAGLCQPDVAIVALHAYTPEDYVEVQRETGMAIDQYISNLRAEIRYQIERAELAPSAVRIEIVEGRSVPDQILAAARRLGAGMIIMATHGRTGLRRVLMGSVAEEVLRHASVPVLIVPVAVLEAMRTPEEVAS